MVEFGRKVACAFPDPPVAAIGGDMNNQTSHTDPASGARALVAAVERTLKDLIRSTGGLTPLELAEAERIRHACRRLLQCAEELAGSEFVVAGSMKQARPHPLLKVEQDLRREITDALRKLCWFAGNRAACDRINAMTREPEPTVLT